jgi:hypothetical protein
LPPIGATVRVRAQPGSAGFGARDVEVLAHLGDKLLKVRYIEIDRESEVALSRLERDESGQVAQF